MSRPVSKYLPTPRSRRAVHDFTGTSPAERRFQRIMDSMLEGCQVIDRSWRYVYLNDTAANQGKVRKTKLLGKTMMECYPGIEQTPLFINLRQCMVERQPRRFNNEFTYTDGSVRYFELRIEPVPEGIFILSIDITDQRHLDDAKKEFVTTASHQLRTPLSAMKWTIERLFADHSLVAAQMKRLHNLAISVERLISTVNNILSVSRIESSSQSIAKSRFSLKTSMESSLMILSSRAQEKNQRIILKASTDDEVFADPFLFSQAFENILTDAIEYGRPDSTIHVTAIRQKADFEISIHDDGIVIGPEERDRIFEKFYRGKEARALVPNSSGLGLFITKNAVEANGGSIRFDSSSRAGTTFYFTVPTISTHQLQV